MVDVSAKQPTRRTATASAFVELSAAVLAALPANPKGNPLEVARFAGIQAAKRTSELIPMCHPLPLTHVDVEATIVDGGVRIRATAATTGANRSRDGSPHRRLRRRPHRLRHDQGARQIHRHPHPSSSNKNPAANPATTSAKNDELLVNTKNYELRTKNSELK